MGWLADPRRVVLAAAIVIAVPVLALGEISAEETRQRIAESELAGAALSAQRGAAVISTHFGKAVELVTTAANGFDLQNAVHARDTSVLRAKTAELQNVLGADAAAVAVVDAAGTPIYGTLSGDIAQSGYVNAARDLKRTAIRVVAAASGQSQRVALAAPIQRSVEPFIGALVVEVRLRDVGEWMQQYLAEAEDLYLLDERGRLLTWASAPGQDIRDLANAPAVAPLLAPDPTAFSGTDPVVGTRRFLAAVPLRDTAWRVVASRSPDALEAALSSSLAQLLLLRVALVVVVLAAALLVGRTARQIAQQRRALAVTNAELAEATAAKSRFLASMSHDLRTPLNAIIGFSEVLRMEAFGPLNEKQQEYVDDIHASGKLQLQLVNEILDLSKIESGKMELSPEEFDLGDALRGVHSVVTPLAAKKAQTLDLSVADAIPSLYQDPVRVKQIVFNLLGNAVKFTPDGGRITTRAAVDGHDRVEIAVSDTGVGIAPADLPNVFAEFERVGSGYTRAQQGSGLGLALVKRFAETMGGTVSVSSVVGQGSTFTVHLPLRQP